MGKKAKSGKKQNELPVSVRDLVRFRPGLKLSDIDPRAIIIPAQDKLEAQAQVGALEAEVTGLQERLFAEARAGGRRRLLIVMQGMDTSGKGGATKALDRICEPLGMRLAQFGAPTKEERAHHYLWRIEQKLPAPGTIGVFDRSHYEDVLIVRVHNLVAPEEWGKRYDEINAWEKQLADDGVVFLKCMFHLSKAEQKERLLARLADPTKHWKYNPGDVDERACWDDYMEAYQVALERCHTGYAPWYVLPVDRKWQRDWLLTHMVLETLREMAPQYPPPTFDVAAEQARVAAS